MTNTASPAAERQDTPLNIVFIDAAVDVNAALSMALPAGSRYFRLAADSDGLEQIAAALSTFVNVDAVHILAHGAPGKLMLGNGIVDVATLSDHTDSLQGIGAALKPQGDLLLYGCDLAKGETGQSLIEQLNSMTGADVAASTDLTGPANTGGNWTLEFSSGQIETPSLQLETVLDQPLGSLNMAVDIFKERGFYSELATLAKAAYQLSDKEQLHSGQATPPHDNPNGSGNNYIKPYAASAFAQVNSDWQVLKAASLVSDQSDNAMGQVTTMEVDNKAAAMALLEGPLTNVALAALLATVPTKAVDKNWYLESNGIYHCENAAAFAARCGDALVISFRGTNDNDNDQPTPDMLDWIYMGEHYAELKKFVELVDKYIANNSGHNLNTDIKKVYVTGHSLGGAMALAYMEQHADSTAVSYESVTFAAPGYSFSGNADPRIVCMEVDGDPVPDVKYQPGYIVNVDIPLTHTTGVQNGNDYASILPSERIGRIADYHSMDIYRAAAIALDQQLPNTIGKTGTNIHGFQASMFNPDENGLEVSMQGKEDLSDAITYTWGPQDLAPRFVLMNGNDVLADTYNAGTTDYFLGGAGSDTLGGTTILTGAGKGFLVGGSGNDVYLVDDTTDAIIELPDGGDDVVKAVVNYTLPDNVEKLILEANSAFLWFDAKLKGVGNALDNVIEGNNSNNDLSGLDGNDLLIAGQGNDTLRGGAGNDTLSATDGFDSLEGGDGNDSYMVTRVDFDFGTTIPVYDINDGGGAADVLTISDITAVADLKSIADLNFKASGTDLIIDLDIKGFPDDDDEGQVIIHNVGTDAGRIESLVLIDDNGITTGPTLSLPSIWSAVSSYKDGNYHVLSLSDSYGMFGRLVTGSGGATYTDGGGGSWFYGTRNNDTLTGTSGNDSFVLSIGTDLLDGGAGIDRMVGNLDLSTSGYASLNYKFNGTPFDYGSTYGAINNGMANANGNYTFNLGALGSTTANNMELAQIDLTATPGSDLLIYQNGTRYNGGGGTDTFYANWAGDSTNIVWLNNPGGSAQNVHGAAMTSLERLLLTTGSGNDNIGNTYTDTADYIATGSGNDTVNAGLGNDWVDTGADNDLLYLSQGNDTLDGGSGSDKLIADIDLTDSGYSLYYRFNGNSYASDRSYAELTTALASATTSYTIVSGSQGATTATNVEQFQINLTGSRYADLLIYQNGTRYNGSEGTDTFYANWSSDSANVEWLNNPNSTAQMVHGAAMTSLERLLLTTGSGNDNIGNTYTDTADYIVTGSGNDTVNAGLGNDWIDTGADNDLLYLSRGNDTLDGGSGSDKLIADIDLTDSGYSLYYRFNGNSYASDRSYAELTTALASATTSYTIVSGSQGATAATNIEQFQINLTGSRYADLLIYQNGTRYNGSEGTDTFYANWSSDSTNVEWLNNPNSTAQMVHGAAMTSLERLLLTTGSGNDNIGNTYTDTADYIATGSGNDTVNAGLGNDWVDTGANDDALYLSKGNDTLDGGSGNDTLIADIDLTDSGYSLYYRFIGSNYAYDRSYNELTTALASATTSYTIVSGSQGTTTATNVERFRIDLTGSNYNDLLVYQNGTRYHGGAGADTFYANWSGDNIAVQWSNVPNGGAQPVHGVSVASVERLLLATGGGNDSIAQSATGTDDYFATGGGNDSIDAADGADYINAGTGDDTLIGGAGADTMVGGAGNDMYSVDYSGDSITEIAGEGTDRIESSVSFTLPANVEILLLTGSATLTGAGNALDNQITGNAGANSLSGGLGNDTLDGGLAADTMAGGLGNDVYTVDNAGDVLTEAINEGSDTVQSSVSLTLASNVENLVLTGVASLNGTGNALANRLTGNAGANLLEGGAGDDTIDGGAGIDTAVYSGVKSAYTITRTATGYIVSGAEGTDTLTNIEALKFSDVATRGDTPVNRDLNGDGKSDLVLRNSATGQFYYYQMNGAAIIAQGAIDTLPTTWTLVGEGDANGDGKSDLLLRNGANGQIYSYFMNGAALAGQGAVATLPDYQVAANADLNGDGKADIVLRNSAGQLLLYTMNGATLLRQDVIDTLPAWTVAGSGDFNSDGKADLVLNNATTGQLYVYLMNGAALAGAGAVSVPAGWNYAGVGDFNGDGRGDILLRNSGGQLSTYLMNGAAIASQGIVTSTLGANWRVVNATGDLNGDGNADILLRDIQTGQLQGYFLNGTTIVSQASITTLANGWNVADAPDAKVAAFKDYNADGKSDLILRNSSTGQFYLHQSNGSTFTALGAIDTLAANWQLVGQGDANGDGKADMLLRNSATGQLHSYLMNGSSLVSQGAVITLPAYRVVANADFDGDGKADIVLRSGAGELLNVRMNGSGIISQTSIAVLPALNVAGWGDFNGDGKADLLIQDNSNGALYQYLMNGAAIVERNLVAYQPGWQAAACGDYNGDGKADLLMRNVSSGQAIVYLLNGAAIIGQGMVATLAAGTTIADGATDYNGDGKADILVRDDSSGQLTSYQMNGTAVLRQATAANPGAAWTVASLAPTVTPHAPNDFNNDGKSDILLRNGSSGQLYQYQMNGVTISGQGLVATLPDWQVVGSGDYNGDGKADMLLRNAAGQLYQYQMDGKTVSSAVLVDTLPGWQVVGDADYNGDGKADILLRNPSNGQLYTYLMNGAAIIGQGVVDTLPAWQVAASADFNGDGRADILLRNPATGQLYAYLMNGAAISGQGSIDTLPAWHVAGSGDYNGDGKGDILLRNPSTGQLYAYLMNGTAIAGQGLINTVATSWQVADGNSDFNGDGKSDLLLRNSSNGQLYIYQMNGLSIASQGLVDTLPAWNSVEARQVFSFDTAPLSANAQTLNGFGSGIDKMLLKKSAYPAIPNGALAAASFVSSAGAMARDANDFISYDTSTGKLYYDADGNGAGAPVLIATLVGSPVLNAADFTIY